MNGTGSHRLFAYVASGVVIATIAAALAITGAPSEERKRRLDSIRRSDLSAIAHAVDAYWRTERRLPESVEALEAIPNAGYRSGLDPDTGEAYGFRALGATTYELCATFDREGGTSEYDDRFWAHGAGRKCFQLDADKRR